MAAIKATVDELKSSDDVVKEEVDGLNKEVDDILKKLGELLAANAVVQGDLRIANLGDLEVAQDLVATGDDDPEVTIQGNLYVEINNTNGLKDNLAAVNKITNKIKIVQKTATITTNAAVEANALTYVAGGYHISGTGSVADGKLRTVNGAMTVDLAGELNYPKLNSVGGSGVTISQTSTVTGVDFGGLVTGKVLTGTGSITLPNAISVKVAGVLPSVVNLAKAITFESNYIGSAQTTTTITVGGANAEFKLKAKKFTGQVTITTTGDVIIPDVTESKALHIAAGKDATIDLSGVTKITGATTLSATTIKLDKLASTTAALTLNGPTAVSLPELATLEGNLTAASAASFEAPKLSTSTGTVDLKAGAVVSIKNIGDAANPVADILDWATIKDLTLTGQDSNLILTAAVALTKLDFTGKKANPVGPGNQNNSLTVTAANASLTTLVLGSDGALGTLTIDNTPLKTLETAGVVISSTVTNNTALETFKFGHTHLNGDNATSISITGNTKVKEVDLSSLAKVKTVVITGNTSLTTIKAPKHNGKDELAEPIANISVTIHTNNTVGTYKKAKIGSETSEYHKASATAVVVSAFKPFINAYLGQQSRTGTVTYDIDVDKIDDDDDDEKYDDGTLSAALDADTVAQNGPDGDNTTAKDNQTNGGRIDIKNELDLFD